jgi:glutamate dehydrogenase/leucine dehydrogenase
VGIIDARGGLVCEEGLSAPEVEDLLLRRIGNRLPAADPETSARERERFWEIPAELFVAAAASGTLDDSALARLEAAGVRSLVAGANHPFWTAAPGDTRVEREADSRFAVVADIIASCGTAHAFACPSGSPMPLSPAAVFDSIRATVDAAVDETVRMAGSTERGLLAAAMELALSRCEQPKQGEEKRP